MQRLALVPRRSCLRQLFVSCGVEKNYRSRCCRQKNFLHDDVRTERSTNAIRRHGTRRKLSTAPSFSTLGDTGYGIRRWSRSTLSETSDMTNPQHVEAILRDLSSRLAHQAEILSKLKEIIKDLQTGPSSSASRPSKKESKTAPGTTAKKIVSTSNYLQPLWWNTRETQKQQEMRKSICEDCFKILKNFDILHRDTHQLAIDCQKESIQLQHVVATMKQIHARHSTTIENMAELTISIRQLSPPSDFIEMVELFLKGRLACQLLCDHILEASKGKRGGAISLETPLDEVIQDSILEASHLCEAHYLMSPSVHKVDVANTALLIRPWLHYALVEVLKNAMSVTVEQAGAVYQQELQLGEIEEDDGSICEPLYVTAEHRSDSQSIQISIHDQGGGLPPHKNPSNVFEFASSEKLYDRMDDQQTYAMTRSPLRGLGVGLNQSRLMLRHFGGDLKLVEREDGHRLANGVELKKGVSTILELGQDLSRLEQVSKT